ncbi:hypothetical protein VB854_28705 [Limnoraphis robusta CCNP1315]|uniref:Uncharacterized protein n=1 Tax=Limnoraphis robusta CCNP1315 TaxID=3110306 RepID=A0ABU5U6X2_9CYAN|nr:hypothetical protein [Limnoraphis robusta CCNP1315]
MLEELNLGSSAFYERLKFLKITPKKEGRKSYITEEQFELVQQLGQHIEATGSMEGFGTNGQLALRNSETSLATADEELGQYEEEISNTQSDFDTQYNGILRSAKEHRAGVEVAKYAIAARLDVEDLDPDLVEEVEKVRAATLPKSVSVSKTAASILQQFMQGRI